MSTGLYETWVTGLRAWQADPTIDLSGLPPLAVDSFTPATYQRLLTHLNTAIRTMMENWNASLAKALQAATTDYDRERALTQSRPMLARRLQLARHPGFPAEVSDQLWKGACDDIRSIQQDLEAGVLQTTARARSSREDQEAALRLVRTARLTVIIEPGYDLDRLFAGGGEPATRTAPTLAPTALPGEPLPTRRRVIVD